MKRIALFVALVLSLAGGLLVAELPASATKAPHHSTGKKVIIVRGPRGPRGPRGKQGPAGTNGTNGATGPQGPPGTTDTTGWAGNIGDSGLPASATAFVFAGPTAQVTTTAGETIVASGSAALGIASGGTNVPINLSICYQASTGGALTVLNPAPGGAYEEVEIIAYSSSYAEPYAMSASGSPGAGTWNVGICVYNKSSTQAINNNDWSIGYAYVTS